MDFGQPNAKIGRIMANGRLLFLGLHMYLEFIKYTYRICTNGDLVGMKVNMWFFFILQVHNHYCFVIQQDFISHCDKFAVAMQ